MELSGRSVLITGASSGIGRALAERMGAEGARLAITARREDLLEEVADGVARAGAVRPAVIAADLSVPGAAAEVANAAQDALGHVDVLVNNAGGGLGGRQIAAADGDEGRRLFDLNVWSPLALVRRLVPPMREQGGGAVVNITSMAQLMTWPALGHYAASKAALASFTENLRLELRGSGVHVLEVIPGPVDTAMYAESRLLPGFAQAMSGFRPGRPEVLARRVIVALRRERGKIVYPRLLRVPYMVPPLVRGTIALQLARVGSDIDPDDSRILRAGSQGDEEVRAARSAWERGHVAS